MYECGLQGDAIPVRDHQVCTATAVASSHHGSASAKCTSSVAGNVRPTLREIACTESAGSPPLPRVALSASLEAWGCRAERICNIFSPLAVQGVHLRAKGEAPSRLGASVSCRAGAVLRLPHMMWYHMRPKEKWGREGEERTLLSAILALLGR